MLFRSYHANTMFVYQFRTFVFSLELYQSTHTARLLRWDRAGVVVTEAFNFVEKPELLVEFLRRFDQLSPDRRGWDPTVQPATHAEAQLLNDAVIDYLNKVVLYKVPHLWDIRHCIDQWAPAWKVRLDDGSGADPAEVIVRKPAFIHPIYCGSGMIERYGLLLGENRLVFMRDDWATYGSSRMPAVDVYNQVFKDGGVRHVPKALYADYVRAGPDRKKILTWTQFNLFKGLAWPITRVPWVPQMYTRLVQDISYPLRFVRSSKELVKSIRGVLVGMSPFITLNDHSLILFASHTGRL